ncbi:MAG: 2-C-methyl-D-erythritol 2,4-cyclodiphosphate synthase [Acidimicrobiia bacterium]|nr:2-C-methyl-D-erythritol 2,4-cyclodiphosphate synthase [Acidimicrobiia bacterium]
MRVGIGFDAHRFDAASAPLRLGGVVVDPARGLAATSDGDVVVHAVVDAVLGAAALGDLGTHFPSSDERWKGADSLQLLRNAVDSAAAVGFRPASVDVTVVAQSVMIGHHRSEMRTALARALGIDVDDVSVKATTTDGMGSIGNDEGIAAMAVATLVSA